MLIATFESVLVVFSILLATLVLLIIVLLIIPGAMWAEFFVPAVLIQRYFGIFDDSHQFAIHVETVWMTA